MYIPCPDSIYENIYKLQPGHILSLRIEEINQFVSLQDNIKLLEFKRFYKKEIMKKI